MDKPVLCLATLPFAAWYSGRPGMTPLGVFVAALHTGTLLENAKTRFRGKKVSINAATDPMLLTQVLATTVHFLTMFVEKAKVPGVAMIPVAALGVQVALTWVLDDELGIIPVVSWMAILLAILAVLLLAVQNVASGRSAIASEFA